MLELTGATRDWTARVSRGRLFITHFLNDGTMYKIIRKLTLVNFECMLSADHVPLTAGIPRTGEI